MAAPALALVESPDRVTIPRRLRIPAAVGDGLYGTDAELVSAQQERWEVVQSAARPWREAAAADIEFLAGIHFTSQQVSQLKTHGQAAVPINQLPRIIEQNLAFLMANAPAFETAPVGREDVQIAAAWNVWLSYLDQKARGQRKRKRAGWFAEACGIGWFHTFIDGSLDHGKGLPTFGVPHSLECYPDPSSREDDISDAEYFVVSKEIQRGRLKRMFWERAEELDGVQTEVSGDAPSTTLESSYGVRSWAQYDRFNTDFDGLRVIETYVPVNDQFYAVEDPVTGDAVEHVYARALRAGGLDQLIRFATQFNLRIRPFRRTVIQRTLTVGDVVLVRDDIVGGLLRPIDRLPFVPLWGMHAGNPYPQGTVRQLRGLNEIVDKAWSVSILHANLMANQKIVAGSEALGKFEQEWKDKGSIPGALLRWDDSDEKNKPPVFVQGLPLPPGFYQLIQDGLQLMDIQSGQFGVSGQGGGGGDRETYRGQMLRDEQSQRRPGLKLFDLEEAMTGVGTLLLQLTQGNVTDKRLARVVASGGRFVELFVDPKSNQIALDGRRVTGNLNTGEYDVQVAPGSTKPTNLMAEEARAMDKLAAGVYDRQAVLERTNDPDAPRILERLAERAQLQQQLEQREEEIQRLRGLLQTEERTIIRSKIEKEVAETTARFDVGEARFEAKLETILATFKAGMSSAIEDVRRAEREARTARRASEGPVRKESKRAGKSVPREE